MILYHGSNVAIEAIDFAKSKPGKDFGVGFYLSPEAEQAQKMAEKKALLFGGQPTITRYEFDEEAAKADAEIAYQRYEQYSMEWASLCTRTAATRSTPRCIPTISSTAPLPMTT